MGNESSDVIWCNTVRGRLSRVRKRYGVVVCMKLKEKLAEESVTQDAVRDIIGYGLNPHDSNDLVAAIQLGLRSQFLAGFEKALEMAEELFRKSWTDPKYINQPYALALNLIANDVLTIGDEEAE